MKQKNSKKKKSKKPQTKPQTQDCEYMLKKIKALLKSKDVFQGGPLLLDYWNWMQKQKYLQPIKILKDIRDDLEQLESSQATLQRQVEVCHLIALCYCRADEHDMAFELWTQDVLKGFKQLFLKSGSIFKFEEICLDICKCFISHLKYYDEMLNIFLVDIKTVESFSLLYDYTRLLTYKGQIKKSCTLLNQNEDYAKVVQGKDYNMAQMFRGKLKKAFGKCPIEFQRLIFEHRCLGENQELAMTFFFFGNRRFGNFKQAWEIIQAEKIKRTEIPLNAINECGIAYQIGDFRPLEFYMEKCFKSKETLALLTKDMFESIDRLDPLRFLHWVRKDLRNKKGSRKFKQHKHGIQHYHNSARIDLLTKKMLKMDASELIFKNYTSMPDYLRQEFT